MALEPKTDSRTAVHAVNVRKFLRGLESQTVARLFLALCLGVGLSAVVCCTLPGEHTITVKLGSDTTSAIENVASSGTQLSNEINAGSRRVSQEMAETKEEISGMRRDLQEARAEIARLRQEIRKLINPDAPGGN